MRHFVKYENHFSNNLIEFIEFSKEFETFEDEILSIETYWNFEQLSLEPYFK